MAHAIIGKIIEVDQVLRSGHHPDVYEVHAELAFWRLNGRSARCHAKTVKGKPNPAGMQERRVLLETAVYTDALLPRQSQSFVARNISRRNNRQFNLYRN